MRASRLHVGLFGILVVLAALLSLPMMAYANEDEEPVILDYRPKENPVADRTVHLNVNKLDSDSHEYVKGARLQVIDKNTKEVMVEWVSGEKTTQLDRELDVDTTYILREVSAPDGYKKAEDVEFRLRSVNFETKGEVLSGAKTSDGDTNAEFNNVSGDIETQAFVISLYDAQEAVERVETRKETRPNQNTNSNERHTSNQQQTSRTETVYHENTNSNEQTVEDEITYEDTRPSNNVVTNQNYVTRENVVTRDNETVDTYTNTVAGGGNYVNVQQGSNAPRGGGTLTQTGDSTSYVPIIVAGVLGAIVIGAAVFMRMRK